MGLPERLSRTEEHVLPAPRVGGPGASTAGTLLPGDPGGLLAESPSILWRPSTHRNVPDRGTGHPNDHGLAQASPRVASLLHLRRNVPRLSGRTYSAESGPRVRTVPRGDPSGQGVSLELSPLRRAYGVSHGWMRRRESFARSLPSREGPRDRPRENDGKLWWGGPPPGPRVQAGGNIARAVSSGVSPLRSAGK